MTSPNQDTKPLMIFSHPNHELAVFGLVQKLRPTMVFLTDGGGPERVAETRRGLGLVGLLDNAHFLDYAEGAFYDALLRRNVVLFEEAALRCAGVLDQVRPSEVYCDAVEYYNPVHDMARPIAERAIKCAASPRPMLFEIPLIHQVRTSAEIYVLQRVPKGHTGETTRIALGKDEHDRKMAALDNVYSELRSQLAPVVSAHGAAHFATEEYVSAGRGESAPSGARLRYEWRARILAERGEIEEAITCEDHYAPTVNSLLARNEPGVRAEA